MERRKECKEWIRESEMTRCGENMIKRGYRIECSEGNGEDKGTEET